MNSRYVAWIGYIGHRYCGFQKQQKSLENISDLMKQRHDECTQKSAPSIQGVLEYCLSEVADHPVRVIASGRTDSGVNATGQVIHFDFHESRQIPLYNLFQALNSKLPVDIRVIRVEKAASINFHAQQSAIKKQYSYYYLQGPTALPWWSNRACWIPKSETVQWLNVQNMNDAAKKIIGEHDFKVFQARGAKPMKTTVRTIYEAEVTEIEAPQSNGFFQFTDDYKMIRIRLVGSGFLKQMVRSVAGTLKQVGEGQFRSTRLIDLVNSGARADVGPTAPAQGLWLERVWYP